MHEEADTILIQFHEEAKVYPELENTSTPSASNDLSLL